MTLTVIPPVTGGDRTAQVLLQTTLALVDLLDLEQPNLERQLAIDLLLSCPTVPVSTPTELAHLALHDARHHRAPQVIQLASRTRQLLARLTRPAAPHLLA
ncbi:hypothetical protein [Deinococcus aluminii]|uniref:Uncharacterized protein n=1 Tax=Deinococcus aluminii TaxID=1656885 RepID=A0ABP9XG40_9DEIO